MSGFFKNIGNKFKSAFKTKDDVYFSNDTGISEFSKNMINDLASFKIIKEQLKENHISHTAIEEIEHESFNLLIDKIELDKGNSKVEVGVIGSFSSGKSTFINSLFGESVCPMAVKPTTSSITKFYYGYKKKITLNEEVITQEEYEKRSKHPKGDHRNTKPLYIEYAYPFERLSSIILYDTPGFNNNENDTKTTMNTLNSVDVIFFVIDVSKGAIDKSSMERLQLPEFKNKRMYCILNKSDLKSAQAIEKIKNEIASKRLFTEVIEYSASKVLVFAEKNYISDHFRDIEEQLIPKKIDFTTTVKGVVTETKGRVKSKVEYKLHIDKREYLIDDFYISSKKQRARVEKMLNIISESKQDTLNQKLKIDIYNYYKKSLSIAEEIKGILNSPTDFSKGNFDEFEQDINRFKDKIYQFEQDNIKNFYIEWNYAFMKSCTVQDVSMDEKSFWSTPYSKVYFDQFTFKKKIKKIDSLRYMEELIDKWIHIFQDKYSFELLYFPKNVKADILQEALTWYSNFYDSESYLLNTDEEGIYFEDKVEAREYLKGFSDFEFKEEITELQYFLGNNQESIERKKRELYSQSSIDRTNITKLQKELTNFIKEKRKYVNRV